MWNGMGWDGMGWDDCLVAKETRHNDANDANDNICIRVRRVWFGCAPQPSAAGECMMDVPMGACVWEEVEELREGIDYLHGHQPHCHVPVQRYPVANVFIIGGGCRPAVVCRRPSIASSMSTQKRRKGHVKHQGDRYA
jgi:hypothetical protein